MVLLPVILDFLLLGQLGEFWPMSSWLYAWRLNYSAVIGLSKIFQPQIFRSAYLPDQLYPAIDSKYYYFLDVRE